MTAVQNDLILVIETDIQMLERVIALKNVGMITIAPETLIITVIAIGIVVMSIIWMIGTVEIVVTVETMIIMTIEIMDIEIVEVLVIKETMIISIVETMVIGTIERIDSEMVETMILETAEIITEKDPWRKLITVHYKTLHRIEQTAHKIPVQLIVQMISRKHLAVIASNYERDRSVIFLNT